MRLGLAILAMVSPGLIRRWILVSLLGHRIARDARVGMSLIDVDRLTLGPGASIGSLNVLRGLKIVRLDAQARIGMMNWVSASPLSQGLFPAAPDRRPALWLREGAAITRRHLLDGSDQIRLGAFSILAGSGSEILTHAIDIEAGCQMTGRVRVGERCFVGTRSVLLQGTHIPRCCVIGAGSVVTGSLGVELTLYGGVPARPIRPLSETAGFFVRKSPHVR
jgi:hypothetical protein